MFLVGNRHRIIRAAGGHAAERRFEIIEPVRGAIVSCEELLTEVRAKPETWEIASV